MSKADYYKEYGNKLFSNGDYYGAIAQFTQAIKLYQSAVYYSNRAACYLKLNQFTQAVNDAKQSVALDENYIKGLYRYVEALIRSARLDEAVKYAVYLFGKDQTSKSRELENEAQRAYRLICDTASSFYMQLYNAAKNLLILTAQTTKILTSASFPIMSSEQRVKSVQKGDEYTMEVCKLVEYLHNLRENLTVIGMKSLPDDYYFLRKSVPSFQISQETMAFYYLVMYNFRITADAFVHYGLTGFICEDDVQKNRYYYTNLAQGCITSISNKTHKLCFYTCIDLTNQKIEYATANMANLVKQDPQFAYFVQYYKYYVYLKDQGTAQYKSNDKQCSQTFRQATLQIFNYEELATKAADYIDQYMALIYLSAEYLAAQTFSNEGMSQSKAGYNSVALALLSAATFLDQTYEKAHQRAAYIYYDAKMFLEAEREYGFASVLGNDQSLAYRIKDCQKQLRPFMRKDYYGILEVDKNTDTNSDEYNKKYKKICAKWHPDRYARDPVMRRFAEIKFRLIYEADGILRDKNKKMIYDQGGDPVNEGAGGHGFSMEDMEGMGGIPMDIGNIFYMMGGMGGGRRGGMGGFPGNVQFTVNGQPFDMGGQYGGRGGRGGRGGGAGLPPGFGDIFSYFFQ